jgi:hypothetical protein
MFDRDDVAAPIRFVDSVDDTEVPTSGAVESGEIELRGLADPLRILRQGAVTKLDDCGTDSGWEHSAQFLGVATREPTSRDAQRRVQRWGQIGGDHG